MQHHQQSHDGWNDGSQEFQAKSQPFLAAHLCKIQSQTSGNSSFILGHEIALFSIGPNGRHPNNCLINTLVDGTSCFAGEALNFPARFPVDLLDPMICKENRHKNDENDGQNCTGHYNACKKITHGSEQVLHASLQIQVNLGHVRGKTVDDATTRCCVQPTHRCSQYCPQCLLVHRNGQSQGAPLEHQNASQGEEQNAKGDHSIDGQSIPRAHLRLNFRPMSQPQSRCQVSNRGDQVQNNDPKGATAHCTHESTPDSQTQVTLFHIFGTLLGFLHYHWSCIFASVLDRGEWMRMRQQNLTEPSRTSP